MYHKFQKNKFANKLPFDLGFGLVELMVSVSIVLVVTSIIMARHGSYNGAVLLRSQAYEVALLAREVQLLAVSAVGESGDYRNVYGLHFNTSTGNYYHTFRDTNDNMYFDSSEQVGRQNNIDSRFFVSAIRLVDGGGNEISSENSLSIVFQRPNFDALFYDAANSPVAAAAVEIDIRVRGTTGDGVGDVRTVEISSTGQIIVQ